MTKNRAIGTHVIVRIDKEAQHSKKFLTTSKIIVPPQYEYMIYNLQYGEILSVGSGVTNPEVKAGRLAIFHHTIEADDKFLIETLPNGDEIRWLDSFTATYSYKLYGVMDENMEIIPMDLFVFCDPEPAEEETWEYETMKFGDVDMRFSTEKVGAIFAARVPKPEREKVFIRPIVTHVPEAMDDLEPGARILCQDFTKYPIKLFDREYWIVSREFIISQIPTV